MKKARKTFAMNDDLEFDLNGKEANTSGDHQTSERKLSALDPASQVVQGLSGLTGGRQVYLVDVRSLSPYPDQPFQPYAPDKLQKLAEDIACSGVLSPVLARRHGRELQILAGHNRWRAAKLAGLSQVPVMILDVSDDEAVLVMTSTNLMQRERLLPSEKAAAYKMQMEALKRQGQRGADKVYDAASFITRSSGDSRMQINRYIRLTGLVSGLMAMLDDNRLAMTPAVTVSALKPEEQNLLLQLLQETGGRLSIKMARDLVEASESVAPDNLTLERMRLICNEAEKGKGKKYFKIPIKRLTELLPKGIREEDIEGYILEALGRMKGSGKSGTS